MRQIHTNKLEKSLQNKYVPEEDIHPNGRHLELPLTATVQLGEHYASIYNNKYLYADATTILEEQIYNISELVEGNNIIFNLSRRHPMPLRFRPVGKNCLVDIDKNKIENYNSVGNKKVELQNIPLEDAVFQLTKLFSDFLFDMENREVYSILDESESIKDYFENPTLKKIFSQNNTQLYSFNQAASLNRSYEKMYIKKTVYRNYNEFVESLSNKQHKDWEKTLKGLKLLQPEKSNEEIYENTNFMQLIQLNQ